MKPLKITHSLLYSWKYATDPEATEKQWLSFLDTLNRKSIADTPAMQDGREFEMLVNIAAGGTRVCCDDTRWQEAARYFGRKCNGGVQQVRAEKNVKINNIVYRLVGVADVVKAGQIFDIKKVVKYEYGKYFNSTQHPMYFELFPQANVFQYLIFDGSMCYTETYRKGDYVPIDVTIREFEQFLKDMDLWDIYKQKWEVD